MGGTRNPTDVRMMECRMQRGWGPEYRQYPGVESGLHSPKLERLERNKAREITPRAPEMKRLFFFIGVKFRMGTENNENQIFTHTQSRALQPMGLCRVLNTLIAPRLIT